MKIAILSAPGREEISARCFVQLRDRNPGVPFWIYRAGGTDPIRDFFAMLDASRGSDLLALEDDVISCRNFFAYADCWYTPHLTSFFHGPRKVVLGVPQTARGFLFNQAIKIPARVLDGVCAVGPRVRPGAAQDDALAEALAILDEPVIYHRTLVQHIGATSMIWPASVTLDHRTALDFPGEDFDALTLLRP